MPGEVRLNEEVNQSLLQRPPTAPVSHALPINRKGNICFLFIIFTTIALIYAAYNAVILMPHILEAENQWVPIAIGSFFHIAFSLFMMSIFTAMRTEPGRVPSHWGFYVGDEARRRRYCRVCNVWKPDRTHHCSQCGRCVLNMDHHCPWINNCVGFYNRKFFIQTLIYANLCLIVVLGHGFWHLGYSLSDFNDLYKSIAPSNYADWAISVVLITFTAVILCGLIPFTRFHWHLLVANCTTIESLDATYRDHTRYDLGVRRNIQQVFGSAPLLWWVPFHLYRSTPEGDGVRWRRNYLRGVNDEV